MDKKDKLINKLLKIAESQQKIIKKLAQQKNDVVYDQQTGFYYGKLAPNDPRQHDPMYGGEVDYSKVNPYESSQSKSAPVEQSQPQASVSEAPEGSELPADLKAAIDKSAPGLKWSLLLDVKGKTVSGQYNADKVKGGPEAVKAMLQRAVGNSYVIGNFTGVTNVILKDWAKSGKFY